MLALPTAALRLKHAVHVSPRRCPVTRAVAASSHLPVLSEAVAPGRHTSLLLKLSVKIYARVYTCACRTHHRSPRHIYAYLGPRQVHVCMLVVPESNGQRSGNARRNLPWTRQRREKMNSVGVDRGEGVANTVRYIYEEKSSGSASPRRANGEVQQKGKNRMFKVNGSFRGKKCEGARKWVIRTKKNERGGGMKRDVMVRKPRHWKMGKRNAAQLQR